MQVEPESAAQDKEPPKGHGHADDFLIETGSGEPRVQLIRLLQALLLP